MQRDSIPKLLFALGASELGEILYSEWPRICEKQVFLHEEIERLKYNFKRNPRERRFISRCQGFSLEKDNNPEP